MGKTIIDKQPESGKAYIGTKTLLSSLLEKNFCPHCGSSDITVIRETVFGDPGYIEKATCDKCHCKF